MTSSIPPNQLSLREAWSSLAPYVGPPVAASVAIVPVYYDMAAVRFMQKGLPVPNMTRVQVLKGGVGAMPTVGGLVGTQMVLQKQVEKALVRTFPNFFGGDSNKAKGSLALASSTLVGALSSPFLAVYNGKTMMPPWSAKESLSKFSLKQAGAIIVQETGFVAGLAAADVVSVPMKEVFGDNKAVEYFAAATSGALGSLAGHSGNTALTRWQSGMSVDSLKQLRWGALRKARGTAVFALVYKLVKDVLNSNVYEKK